MMFFWQPGLPPGTMKTSAYSLHLLDLFTNIWMADTLLSLIAE